MVVADLVRPEGAALGGSGMHGPSVHVRGSPLPQERWRTRLAREPLVHFLLLGLLLFMAFDVLGGERGALSRKIVVDDAIVADLAKRYAGVWQRPPSRAELDGLIADYVKDEVLYRQGMAMGLVEDDPVVRRRIRQKLEVMSEESRDSTAPTGAQLESWLRQHADKYRQPPALTFDQVYFDPAKHGGGLGAAVSDARAKLAAGTDFNTLGDVSMLPGHVGNVTPDRIVDDFGDAFASAIAKQPLDRWFGPVRSGLGQHLVRITARKERAMPRLADVRTEVKRDWEDERRSRNAQHYYETVRKDYDVVVTADLGKAGSAAQ